MASGSRSDKLGQAVLLVPLKEVSLRSYLKICQIREVVNQKLLPLIEPGAGAEAPALCHVFNPMWW